MKKKFLMVLIIVLSMVWAYMILDEENSRLLSTLLILVTGTWIVIKGLEIKGTTEMMKVLGFPAVVPVLTKVLTNLEIADYIVKFFNYFLNTYLRINNYQIDKESSMLVVLWLLFCVIQCIRNNDTTAMKMHKGKEEEIFKEKDYLQKSEKFCRALRQRIEEINRETDWNEDLFTPIDAEVEVCIGNKQKKKYDDLLKCLKGNKKKDTIYLVLGEPGAGKSVSLRKLCLELLEESKKTKKIPVYINLKKWNKNWDLDNLPTKKDLIEFISSVLYEKGDILTDGFLKKYFEKMLEDGRWYFIFDSFDEMPCLMGRKNCQELIDKVSELFYQFLSDTNQSGGIIASRLFKSPSEAIGATVTLKIQSFSDIKIKTMIHKYIGNEEEIVKELFGKREDLVVLCRNPFYLSLLLSYISERDGKFPKNQMELYQSFVTERLKKCAGKLESENVSAQDVHSAAKKLAVFMHESEIYGLECPASALYETGDEDNWRKTIKMLEYAKLCRCGGYDDTVSFVHRRFQEFFLVESIIEEGKIIEYASYESIVNNSHMRDALVLYCEVAEEEKASEIAEFCWNVVKENIKYSENILEQKSIELVNTIYFMTEAFRNRKTAIAGFINEFQLLVENSLNKKTDFVIRFALTNSMVLFDQEYLQHIVLKVFELKNRWLSDIVMQNSRIIDKLDYTVEKQFIEYWGQLDVYTFWKRFRNVTFSLSLSAKFRFIRVVHYLILLMDTMNAIGIILIGLKVMMNLKEYFLFIMRGVELLSINGLINILEYNTVPQHIESRSIILATLTYICVIIVMLILTTLGKRIKSFLLQILLFFSLIYMYGYMVGGGIVLVLSIPTILLTLILLWHEIYNIRNHDFMIIKSNIKEIILALLVIVAVIISYILPSELSVYLFAIGITIYLVWFLLLVFIGIIYLLETIKDRKFVSRQPDLKVISRKRVEENLRKIHRQKWKKRYISNLLVNKVELIDEWSEGTRIKCDDELEFMLAKLECMKHDSLNYWF